MFDEYERMILTTILDLDEMRHVSPSSLTLALLYHFLTARLGFRYNLYFTVYAPHGPTSRTSISLSEGMGPLGKPTHDTFVDMLVTLSGSFPVPGQRGSGGKGYGTNNSYDSTRGINGECGNGGGRVCCAACEFIAATIGKDGKLCEGFKAFAFGIMDEHHAYREKNEREVGPDHEYVTVPCKMYGVCRNNIHGGCHSNHGVGGECDCVKCDCEGGVVYFNNASGSKGLGKYTCNTSHFKLDVDHAEEGEEAVSSVIPLFLERYSEYLPRSMLLPDGIADDDDFEHIDFGGCNTIANYLPPPCLYRTMATIANLTNIMRVTAMFLLKSGVGHFDNINHRDNKKLKEVLEKELLACADVGKVKLPKSLIDTESGKGRSGRGKGWKTRAAAAAEAAAIEAVDVKATHLRALLKHLPDSLMPRKAVVSSHAE